MTEKVNIFTYIKDVSSEKEGIWNIDPELSRKIYSRYMTDLMLSQHMDCILVINELNCRPNLPQKWHYDYLLQKLQKRKRFAKLDKPDIGERVELVMSFFGYSTDKALAVIDLFSDADFVEMRERRSTGGLVRKTKKER